MTKVFVVDSHEIVRQGLCRLLEHTPDFELAGQASDAWNLIENIKQSGAELLIMDVDAAGPDALELIGDLRKQIPAFPILILSAIDDVQKAAAALNAGALGYLTKGSDCEMITRAMRHCLQGTGYIQPELGRRMLQAASQAFERAPHQILSAREKQIFFLLANGTGINEISEKLHISPKTVSTHKFRIMQKMALATITDLVRYAIRHRLIEA